MFGTKKEMDNHHKKGGKFLDGFFWGAVLGGGLASLLSTKRGRELLKDLASDGMNMLDDLTAEPEMAEEELSPFPNERTEDVPPAPSPLVAEAAPEAVEAPPVEKKTESAPPVKKRFFKAGKK